MEVSGKSLIFFFFFACSLWCLLCYVLDFLVWMKLGDFGGFSKWVSYELELVGFNPPKTYL